MRFVRYVHLVPGSPQECVKDLLSFVRFDSYLGTIINHDKELPEINELNRVLLSGRGDEGHFLLSWQPFQLTDSEYQELGEAVKTLP
jgi:hypothetical protein